MSFNIDAMLQRHWAAVGSLYLTRRLALCVCLLFVVGCHTDDENSSAELGSGIKILAIGDSALEWNGDLSTPAQLEIKLRDQGLNASVRNRSVGGATLGCGQQNIGMAENCIPPQYEEQDWDFVLISGGANDILDSGCQVSADALISADLSSGLMPELLRRVLASSKKVILYGYFLPLDANGTVATCNPVYTLLQRYRSLAQENENIIYVDAGQVVQRTSPEYYADDIHPSEAGSTVIAELLVDAVVQNQ